MKAGLPITFSWKWLAQLAGFAGLYFALARFGNVALVAEGDVFLFLLCAGATPALVDALGVASLCWGGVGKWDDFRGLWLLSWAGDLMGTLIAAPALLVWTWPDNLRWTPRKRIEAAVGFSLLAICSMLIFTGKLSSTGVGFPFLVLPIVVWIAVRLGQRATVSA